MIENKIAIIGAGSWGTTLAIILANKGIEIELHSAFADHNLAMQRERENKLFLKGVKFPPKLSINYSLKEVLKNKNIVIAIPVKYIRSFLKKIRKQMDKAIEYNFISVSKGIEIKSLKRVSQLIEEELGQVNVLVLSGPTIAKEVFLGIPTAAVLACKDLHLAKALQALLTTKTFRIYAHHDVIGVELAGALKNIIALACGISDGLGFGTNTKAALLTRGLVEIVRLGEKLGADPKTFWGISGLGDLATTCFSLDSRNRTVGQAIGQGKKIKDILDNMAMVAEGVGTAKSAYLLSKKLKIEMPITEQVYAVLYKNKLPKQAVAELLARPLKEEGIG